MKKAILIFLVLGLLTVSCKRKEDEKKSTISERVEPSAEVMNALLALELSAGVDVEIKQ